MNNSEKTMDKIVALCKNRGFVYPGRAGHGAPGDHSKKCEYRDGRMGQ